MSLSDSLDMDAEERRSFDDEAYLAQIQDMNSRLLDTQRELLKANRKATEADRAKDEFVARMSHDMRTPLNAIMGFNSLLDDELASENPDSDKARQYIAYSNASAKFLLALISDILDFSKIEKGTLTLLSEPFSLASCIESVDSMIRMQATAKNVKYGCESAIDSNALYVGDETRLQQVLMNLLNNAVKFTPEGGEVRLSAEYTSRAADADAVKFTVSDTGVGIDPAFQEQMFKPFSQEQHGGIAGTSGAGLGLAIVKRVVDAMGGTVEVESAKDQGSTFSIALNLDIASGNDADVSSDASIDLSGLRILVCDDNELNRIVLREMLGRKGCIVEEAVEGSRAVEAFDKSPEGYFDIVLMDIRMPVMDGYAATRAMRMLNRRDAASVQVFALTADAFAEDVRKALAAGMNGHITKPVDPTWLYRLLSDAARRQN